MISLGVLLVILGVGSLVLPSLGVQLTWLDAYQPWAGIIVAAVGLITVLFGAQRRGRESAAPTAVATAQAAPPAEASTSPSPASPPQASAPAERSWPTEPPERPDEP